MKKKFLFLMTLMAVSLLALAEEHVYVYKKNGAKVHYMAAELDSIGFRGATRGEYRGHEWVDLGLPSGTLWATSYMDGKYTWGDIRVNEENNKWQSSSTYKKYNDDDKKTILELQDDAAHMCWGGDWRMPTDAEFNELKDNCTWTWTTQNGVNGYKVTSKTNGNSIFLPAAGYRYDSDLNYAGSSGCYRSSSLNTSGAYYLYFSSSEVSSYSDSRRYGGHSVRPVFSE